jgi:hypothetical protein
MTRIHWWRVVPVLIVIGAGMNAQETIPRDSTIRIAGSDTLRIRSEVIKEDSAGSHPSHSTLLAMGLSALVPGGGQIYNRSYWKVPLLLGLGGYFIYEFIDNNRQYIDYRDQYQAGLATNPAGNNRILTLRDFYKDQRDSFGWYFLILYLANIADAYVDASLYEFDVGSNLGMRSGPPGSPSVTLRIWLR